jgi:cardiolipin synthase (CMP-forming)
MRAAGRGANPSVGTLNAMLATLPNVLTTARLVALVPFIILLAGSSDGQSIPAAVIFAAASATDFLDGYIARRTHASSRFGRIADPLADRLLINLTVILLAYENRMSWWLAAPLLLRDIYLMITFERRHVATEVHVNRAGKWATATIMFALLVMMLTTAVWPVVLYTAGLVISLAAAFHYALRTQGELSSKPS